MSKNRKNIDLKFKWKLEDIFSSNEEWEQLFIETEKDIPKISNFVGKLSDDALLLKCLKLNTFIGHNISKLYTYAHMRSDEDTRIPLYQGMDNRAEQLIVKFGIATSFISPELVLFSDERIKELIANSDFEDYSVFFKQLLRDKSLILSDREEKIISEVSLFSGNNQNVFSMFNNADIKFKSVNVEGSDVELTHGVYSSLIMSPNRQVRKDAFVSMFSAFKEHINTLAANYDGNCKADWFYAKIRKFTSSMAYSLYSDDIPVIVYTNLVNAVDANTKKLHKYISYKAKSLGLKDMNMWDMYVPLIQNLKTSYSYKTAVDMVKNALKVMGAEYSDILASSFTDGWIDVYENKGKRSGAYSWGCYGVHPYVLLNFNGNIHDVFTLAHELGHSMHTYFSNKMQCEEKAEYKIFVAEIASTVNEVLLLKYLLKDAEGDMRKYLLCYYLEMFRTTLFRQTQFAEFELIAHNAVEKGIPLNAEYLSNEYEKLNNKYYGPTIKKNDLIKYEWARIPHFYTSFYVYKYATGITAAVSIASKILKYGDKYVEKYKNFLSAGSSMSPLDILKLAEVDLSTTEPFENAMKEFANTLKELIKD